MLLYVKGYSIQQTNKRFKLKLKMATTRGIDYWTSKGMFGTPEAVNLTKKSWRRCDELNGLHGDDRLHKRTYMWDGYQIVRYYQKVFCPYLRLNKEDSLAVEFVCDDETRMTHKQYWIKKGMLNERSIRTTVAVTKKSWRRHDWLNGLRGDDRLQFRDFTKGGYTRTTVTQKVLCKLYCSQEDADEAIAY